MQAKSNKICVLGCRLDMGSDASLLGSDASGSASSTEMSLSYFLLPAVNI